MLGQATSPSGSLSSQILPAERKPAETPRSRARRRLESRIGERSAALFDGCGREQRVERGDLFALGDETGDWIYIVLDGVVGLYRELPSGNRDVLGYCYCGDLIAPARLGGGWGFDAKSLTGGRLLVLPLPEVRAQAGDDPDLAWLLFATACAELARRTARLRGYLFLPVKARMATFLLEMDEGIGKRSDRGLVVRLPMFRDEIATYLGTRTETICRILTGWKDKGLIVMDSPRVLVIPDSARLQADAFA